ncbi:MAG: hypothetical protein LQ341_007347, partial [Variospora aurantia]
MRLPVPHLAPDGTILGFLAAAALLHRHQLPAHRTARVDCQHWSSSRNYSRSNRGSSIQLRVLARLPCRWGWDDGGRLAERFTAVHFAAAKVIFHLERLRDDLVGTVFASDAFVGVDAIMAEFKEFSPRAGARSHDASESLG